MAHIAAHLRAESLRQWQCQEFSPASPSLPSGGISVPPSARLPRHLDVTKVSWCFEPSQPLRATSRLTPQWGAADAEIKVPSGENTELKRSAFKAWSRSVYNLTCYAYCQGFLPCLFPPFPSIHLHFFQNLSRFFPVLAVANAGSCVGPQNKIGHSAGCRFPC